MRWKWSRKVTAVAESRHGKLHMAVGDLRPGLTDAALCGSYVTMNLFAHPESTLEERRRPGARVCIICLSEAKRRGLAKTITR